MIFTIICSFVLFWVIILFQGGFTQMSPLEIPEEYDFKIPENYSAPDVELLEEEITVYFSLNSEVEC